MNAKDQSPESANPSSGPIEYKDAPIRFTFVLDGREEPVKIVEPNLDLPFPDGALLRVEESGELLCDVVFHFDMQAGQPYRLEIRRPVEAGRKEEDLHLSYGAGVFPANDMRAVYHRTIVNRGRVHARIEMTRRKARLQIRYRGPEHFPSPGA